jgi:hypothetical protein
MYIYHPYTSFFEINSSFLLELNYTQGLVIIILAKLEGLAKEV